MSFHFHQQTKHIVVWDFPRLYQELTSLSLSIASVVHETRQQTKLSRKQNNEFFRCKKEEKKEFHYKFSQFPQTQIGATEIVVIHNLNVLHRLLLLRWAALCCFKKSSLPQTPHNQFFRAVSTSLKNAFDVACSRDDLTSERWGCVNIIFAQRMSRFLLFFRWLYIVNI